MSDSRIAEHNQERFTSTPSRLTLHRELLRLCARIGYSPHATS